MKSFLIVSMLTGLGCASVKLQPGAEKVIASRAPAPQGCKFLGSLVGSQGGAWSGPMTSNAALAEGAMNDMKNRAFDLGGNYVVIESSQAGMTQSGNRGSFSGQETDVTNTGNAYKCPPEAVGL